MKRYLEDDTFIEWVYRPTWENDSYWKSYISKYPEEKQTIKAIREILLALKTEDTKISNSQKQFLLAEIQQKIKIKTRKSKGRHLFRRSLKYAAILVVVFGSSVYLLKDFIFKGDDFMLQPLPQDAATITETQLILDSGEKVDIETTESTVQYSKSGSIVVNKTDTLNVTSTSKVEPLNRLVIPYGKRSKITLADGTVVHLNSGSQFAFPNKFTGDNRQVFLIGEGFFEVASNREKPFVVKTMEEELSIKALGTKFNVSAYPSDNEILTVLTEGEVHITEPKNIFKDYVTKLEPGQLATWNGKTKIEVKHVNIDNHILWTRGLLQFESEPFNLVLKKLERFYNVEIGFDSTSGEAVGISGKLDLNDEIAKTLENLASTTNLKVNKTNDNTYMIE